MEKYHLRVTYLCPQYVYEKIASNRLARNYHRFYNKVNIRAFWSFAECDMIVSLGSV